MKFDNKNSVVVVHEQDKPSYCLGCNEVLRYFSMLICPECLDDDCNNYLKLIKDTEIDE